MMKFLTEPALLLTNRVLVITDLHLGIEYEIYKSGITVPSQIEKLEERIDNLIKSASPQKNNRQAEKFAACWPYLYSLAVPNMEALEKYASPQTRFLSSPSHWRVCSISAQQPGCKNKTDRPFRVDRYDEIAVSRSPGVLRHEKAIVTSSFT